MPMTEAAVSGHWAGLGGGSNVYSCADDSSSGSSNDNTQTTITTNTNTDANANANTLQTTRRGATPAS